MCQCISAMWTLAKACLFTAVCWQFCICTADCLRHHSTHIMCIKHDPPHTLSGFSQTMPSFVRRGMWSEIKFHMSTHPTQNNDNRKPFGTTENPIWKRTTCKTVWVYYQSALALFPGLPRFYLTFVFVIIHGNRKLVKNREGLLEAFITWVVVRWK